MRRNLYHVQVALHSSPAERILLNEDKLLETAPYKHYKMFSKSLRNPEFWPMSEKPLILVKEKKKRLNKDVDIFRGFWIVSDRCKILFEKIDKKAFEFLQCFCVGPNDEEIEGYWLCSVVRFVDALDEEKTDLIIKNNPSWYKSYQIQVHKDLYFIDEKIDDIIHLFSMAYLEYYTICDEEFKKNIKLGKISNLRFENVRMRHKRWNGKLIDVLSR